MQPRRQQRGTVPLAAVMALWIGVFVPLAFAKKVPAPVAQAGADAFTFTSIADTRGPFQRFDFPGAPSVNNAGTVAFLAELDTGVAGIFAGDGRSVTTIADSSGIFLGIGGFGQYPAINAQGTVAFGSTLDSGTHGVFTGRGGQVTTIADTTSGPFVNAFGHPALNNAGTVIFTGTKKDGTGSGIFASRRGMITTLIDTTTGIFNGFQDRPSLNDQGTVAFIAGRDAGGFGIFTVRRGVITTIVDTDGPFTNFGVPSINNAEAVAFFACFGPPCAEDRDSAAGIFVATGDALITIADTTGPFHFFGNPSINNVGSVAFVAFLDRGGSGVFTGPDPVADKVVATGDAFFGSTIVDFGVSQGLGLNDVGQIAFFARLADGTEGIYLARPTMGHRPRN
jgi:hypothetical protein